MTSCIDKVFTSFLILKLLCFMTMIFFIHNTKTSSYKRPIYANAHNRILFRQLFIIHIASVIQTVFRSCKRSIIYIPLAAVKIINKMSNFNSNFAMFTQIELKILIIIIVHVKTLMSCMQKVISNSVPNVKRYMSRS